LERAFTTLRNYKVEFLLSLKVAANMDLDKQFAHALNLLQDSYTQQQQKMNLESNQLKQTASKNELLLKQAQTQTSKLQQRVADLEKTLEFQFLENKQIRLSHQKLLDRYNNLHHQTQQLLVFRKVALV
jgi:hypothetical protein